jgi:hypothetical protein
MGQAFTITLTGSNFSASNSTVFFSGPGCTASPCSFNAGGSGSRYQGRPAWRPGLRRDAENNTTGLTSAGVSLTVANAATAPEINQISTSPNFPITGQAFTITLTGSNFDPSNRQSSSAGPMLALAVQHQCQRSSTSVSGQITLRLAASPCR